MPSMLFKRKVSPRLTPSRKPAPIWHPDFEMPTLSAPQPSVPQHQCYAAVCEASNCPRPGSKTSETPRKRKHSTSPPLIEPALPPFPTLKRVAKPVRLPATPAMQRSTLVGSMATTNSFGSLLSLSSGDDSSSSSVESPKKRSFLPPPKTEFTRFFESKGENLLGFKQVRALY